jgi:glucosamine-phosphate N-acetyltransferase
MGDNLLFSASLLTPLPSLPAGFNVRPLSIDDFSKDFLKVLEELTVVGNVTQHEFETRFKEMQRQGVQYMIVIEDTTTNKIAAIGSILIEKKFTHHISHVGDHHDLINIMLCLTFYASVATLKIS